MVRFGLRRDRVRLPSWILGIALLVPLFYFALVKQTPTQAVLQARVALVGSPLGTLFAGPLFPIPHVTIRWYFVTGYLGEYLLAAALMSILLVARHTRAEEQSGRAELVRAGVIGRHAPLTAALAIAAIANIALGLLIAGALAIVGFPAQSALLFGSAVAVTGLAFGGITAVTAQVTERSGVATGLTGMVFFIAWILRAAGALQEVHGGPLSWISPLAWPLQTRVLAGERWWPLALSVALVAGAWALAYALSARRDLGAGFVHPRPGRSSAPGWLRSPFTLALRIQRGSAISWAIALFISGLVYGALGAVNNGVVGTLIGGADVFKAYVSLIAVSMTFVVGVFAILSVHRMRAEETSGRAESVLATATSRSSWLGSSLLASAFSSIVLLAVTGLAIGLGAAMGTGNAALVGEVAVSLLARAPEVLVLLAFAGLLLGFAPRLIGASWAVLAYGVFVRYFAPHMGWPGWALSISPFNHVPWMPLEAFSLAPFVVLTAIAGALVTVSLYCFGRRDIDSA